MKKHLLLFPLLAFCCGCGVSSLRTCLAVQAGHECVETKGELTFYVGDSAFDGRGMLEGVNVWMIRKNGKMLLLGKTDVFGGISLKKKDLAEGVALIFSLEEYFDGAWRVNGGELQNYDELFLQLAHFANR